MPQLANITVKKNDGTTDILWSGVVPSSGDKNSAIWRSLTVGLAVGHQPSFQLSSRNNGNGTARRMEGYTTYPYVVTGTDGKMTVQDKAIIEIGGVIPLGMPIADINEAVSQSMNLFVSTLIKDCFKQGYSAT